MRIYWLNGGLKIEPETEREFGILSELAAGVKFGPPGMEMIPIGQTDSGSQGLIDAIVRDLKQSADNLDTPCKVERPAAGTQRTAKIIPLVPRRA